MPRPVAVRRTPDGHRTDVPGEAAGGAASAFRQVKSNKTKIFAEKDRRIGNKYVHLFHC